MKFILYAKGVRGLLVTKSLLSVGLVPCAVVIEKSDDDLKELCRQYNVEIKLCSKPKDKTHFDWLNNRKPDLLVAAGYSKIIPAEILNVPSMGAINCHGGRLPYYRGASPIPWQIINGETEGAASVLVMTENIDDGPMLSTEKYPIGQSETARDITDRVNKIFAKLIPKVVRQYAEGNPPVPQPQPDGQACIWTRRYPRDGLILWNTMTSQEVVNLIRGLDEPYPGAFTYFRGGKIVIKKAIVHPTMIRGVPGRFVGSREGLPTIIAKDVAVGILSFSVNNCNDVPFPLKYGDDLEYS